MSDLLIFVPLCQVLYILVQEWCVRYYSNCAPGDFNLQDHLEHAMKQERKTMTIESLYEDIDWDYIHELTALHWVRILVTFIPELAHLRKAVAAALDSPRMTKRRLRCDRKSVLQPLMTNGEREVETQGMLRAILDYEGQLGLTEEALENLIIIPCRDGASIAAIWRIKRYLAAHPSHYKFNAIASNCYGPATSMDPSALSKSATAAGAKRPADLKKVDFFPTSRSMTLFYEAHILDCWRISFGANNIITYFQIGTFDLPDLDKLWADARILIWILFFSGSSNRNYASYLLETYCLHRYESSEAFSNALLDNWLVKLTNKWTECDFTQEGFNKWLEEMVEHKGGDFNDHFYRHTLSPNVFHFLRIKEQMEEAFELKHRSKNAWGSPPAQRISATTMSRNRYHLQIPMWKREFPGA
ncbi:hypothetical protein DFH09DRAFT_1340751 [Mycena vulgaris]|nr:hypothetical protein DFH09DRAFT_1340751 [Mycena vulgaris]